MGTRSALTSSRVALLRFVAAGSAGNVVYSLVYLALAQGGDAVTVPSLVASAVSTVAVSEAHRRWTFRATGRPSALQAHLSGLASAVAGSALTVLALLALSWLSPDASTTSELALSWAVTGLVGLANFLHLRWAASRAQQQARERRLSSCGALSGRCADPAHAGASPPVAAGDRRRAAGRRWAVPVARPPALVTGEGR